MDKIVAFFSLFRKGEALEDPGALQNIGVLAAFIVAVAGAAKVFGYDLHIDEQTATGIATGVAALVGVVLTITSEHVGLPAKPATGPTAGQPAAATAAPVDSSTEFPKIPGSD